MFPHVALRRGIFSTTLCSSEEKVPLGTFSSSGFFFFPKDLAELCTGYRLNGLDHSLMLEMWSTQLRNVDVRVNIDLINVDKAAQCHLPSASAR